METLEDLDRSRCKSFRLRHVSRHIAFFAAVVVAGLDAVRADDRLGLKRGGNPADISISGVSSGAAMAVQYAVAHSGTVVAVGSIAGPAWGCADGRLSQAVNACMCSQRPVPSRIAVARTLASGDGTDVDPLVGGTPQALKRSWIFHSPGDRTVGRGPADAGIDFLAAFIGKPPIVDRGNDADGSHAAGHGILSPSGTDPCNTSERDTTYVRSCGKEDNPGKMFLALYGQGERYDASKRTSYVPESAIWRFDQQVLIDSVKKNVGAIASDLSFLLVHFKSARRKNFDMAKTGYLYVPPSCRPADSRCRIHIALHGCRQDAKAFAAIAGYNNWAEHYRTIVIYPAIEPSDAPTEAVCETAPVPPIADTWVAEPNLNGCWDWWGYLDIGWPDAKRYLTKRAPQIQVIERIISEVTAPVR